MSAILLVDDRPENLVALTAILEPLRLELVCAGSGDEALRVLLRRDSFAVILLDAQMPELDGFETAAIVRQRERTRNIPIIFLTAISKEETHVRRGYEVGAVDYVFKPLDPEILRGKVSVFVELYEKNEELRRQRELLAEHELGEVRREGAVRYRQLADAMPQIVWTTDSAGRTTYCNRRFLEYTGTRELPEAVALGWGAFVHPHDASAVRARHDESVAAGAVFEAEFRLRGHDGSYRWYLGRAVPIRVDAGRVESFAGTATDIDSRKRNEEAQLLLLEAGTRLSRSLDYRETLRTLAALAVPQMADLCAVHLVEDDGAIRQVALEHADAAKRVFLRELDARYPPDRGGVHGVRGAIASGEPEFLPEVTDELLAEAAVDDTHLDLARQLGLRSSICVPLVSRERTLGAITFATAESGRVLGEPELRLAVELAQRAATAVDNARLYEQAEQRGRAVLALRMIADGVALLDPEGRVLLWNDAAEAITGLAREHVLGRVLDESLPLPLSTSKADVPDDGSRAQTVPIEIGGRELWLAASRVRFEEGTVYTFRDVTRERRLEQIRSDMVATVSHELRTPLSAIYGAAITLNERERELDEQMHASLMRVIVEESERLSQIVSVILLASHLDSGQLELHIETVDALELTGGVVRSAQAHLPGGVSIAISAPKRLPAVAADEQQLRQVLTNLVENAVKYSPDGGEITVSLARRERYVEWAVRDRGIGIPASERRRIFEKFYRLDPEMTGGIGGTGLGLYVCRELVRRLEGRIWVEANEGGGSVFFMRIPVTGGARSQTGRPRQTA